MSSALKTRPVFRPRFGSPRLPATYWARVVRGPRGCWLWTGPVDREGYPTSITIDTRRQSPFRHAYIALIGPIPPKLTLDHTCRVRRCVKPSHADPCTGGENAARAKRRVKACPSGHRYTKANTIMVGPGKSRRGCRTCYNDRSRAYWHSTRRARLAAEREAIVEAWLETVVQPA